MKKPETRSTSNQTVTQFVLKKSKIRRPKIIRPRYVNSEVGRHDIKKTDLRKLARRGGILYKIDAEVWPLARQALRSFLTQLIKDTVHYTTHARRFTVTAQDVLMAIQKQGKMLYGFGNTIE